MRIGILIILFLFILVSSYSQEYQKRNGVSAVKLISAYSSKADSSVATTAKITSATVAKLTAKKDSLISALQAVSKKYIDDIESKTEQYANRITGKTIKTLEKLSKWENKIKSKIRILKPEVYHELFENDKLTFSYLLNQAREGKNIAVGYRKKYDAYRDKLTLNLEYINANGILKNDALSGHLHMLRSGIDSLNKIVDNTEQIEQLIKKRKKELISSAFEVIGKDRHLEKINKETWYYIETLKNYKKIFQEESKIEAIVKKALSEIPGFSAFIQKNSMLAKLFGSSSITNTSLLEGLQTRSEINDIIQGKITEGGPNAHVLFSQQLKAANSKIAEIRKKIHNPAYGNGEGKLPDFKPNFEKAKTFKQRLIFGTDIQFSQSNSLMPTTMDVSISAGYKLSNKSTIGLGAVYKLGFGSIGDISFTNQGFGLRSFYEWKLKKNLSLSGGYEINYLAALPQNTFLAGRETSALQSWQHSALAGFSKTIKIKTKWFKETKILLVYDFLAKQHLPASQPVLFRVGYNF